MVSLVSELPPGSSPLARGLRAADCARAARTGIIPARAGFTLTDIRRSIRPGDHPRSRGVYAARLSRRLSNEGSSPLARGLPLVAASIAYSIGIIPARAGFTFLISIIIIIYQDHPRSRGVYGHASVVAIAAAGSSPLARGLPLLSPLTMISQGIIPARAGFTSRLRGDHRDREDHPRSRGVYHHHHHLSRI